MTISMMMIIFGVILLYTPNIFLKGDDADLAHLLINLSLEKLIFIQSCTISGLVFLGGGVAMLAAGL
jgi:uncharacterized membrane protein